MCVTQEWVLTATFHEDSKSLDLLVTFTDRDGLTEPIVALLGLQRRSAQSCEVFDLVNKLVEHQAFQGYVASIQPG